MGSGCLGPKKHTEEIYVTVIMDIHEEAKKITSSQNLDLYQAIKEKLMRKGHLRKLTDHLSSRRARIPEAMNFNFRTIGMQKEIESLYAGIIIADSVVDLVYQPFSDLGMSFVESEGTSSSIFSTSFKTKQRQSFSFPSLNSKKTMEANKAELYPEVNNSLDDHYFKLIIYLFDKDFRVHHRLLKSVKNFCQKHVGLIRCESQVWRVVNQLRANIVKKNMLEETFRVFSLLLSKIKDRATQELRNHHTLCTLLQIWSSMQATPMKATCEEIIAIHFNRCINSWDCEFLYQVIFRILDDSQFSSTQQQKLSELISQLLEGVDLRDHFFRGKFNYLLGYLAMTRQNAINNKWFAVSLGLNSQSMRNQYKNAMKESVKIRGFKVLNKWIDKAVTIDQIMKYNSKSLIFAFSANIAASESTSNFIMEEFLKLIKKMSQECRDFLKMRIIEEFKEVTDKSIEEQQTLLKILKEILFRGNEPIPIGMLDNFLIPLKLSYDHSIKIQLLRVIGFLLQNVKEQHLRMDTLGKIKICEFLHSIYECISDKSQELQQRYEFTCAGVSFMKILAGKYDKSILFAFLDRILHSQIHYASSDIYLEIQYCLLFLGYELRALTSKHPKIPEGIARINILIGLHSDEEQIYSKMREYLSEKEEIPLDELLENTPYNQQDFEESQHILRQLFKDKNIDEIGELKILHSHRGSLRRSLSVNSKFDDKVQSDRSFQDILDIIHG